MDVSIEDFPPVQAELMYRTAAPGRVFGQQFQVAVCRQGFPMLVERAFPIDHVTVDMVEQAGGCVMRVDARSHKMPDIIASFEGDCMAYIATASTSAIVTVACRNQGWNAPT